MSLKFKFELLKDTAEVAKVGNPEEDDWRGEGERSKVQSRISHF